VASLKEAIYRQVDRPCIDGVNPLSIDRLKTPGVFAVISMSSGQALQFWIDHASWSPAIKGAADAMDPLGWTDPAEPALAARMLTDGPRRIGKG